MRKVKWIFFGYIAFTIVLICAIAVSPLITAPRDPSTLYTAYIANLKTFDPAEIQDDQSALVVGNTFETLYNYEYGVEPYKLFPQCAAEMPTISEDGKTWTIKLRKGIRFYDPTRMIFADGKGNEVKAQDWVYSWKRVCNFQLGNAGNYSAIFEGKIEGLDDWWAHTKSHKSAEINWERPVSGFSALDDYTIQIKLTEPYPQLIYNLAHQPTSVVCRAAVEKLGEQFKKHAIGTGPYAIVEHLEEQRVVLEANPIYRGRPDVDGYAQVKPEDRLPRITRLQMDYFPEDMPRWLIFRKGLIDRSGIPKDSFSEAVNAQGELTEAMRRDHVVIFKDVEPGLYYIGFNMLDPVVGKNKPLRQAMSMAYDRDTLIRIYLNGRGKPATGPIPPGFATYDPNRRNRYTEFNLLAAKALMEEALRIQGGPIPRLTFYVGGTETDLRQMAEFFVSQMAQIGVDVRPVYNTWARHQEVIDDEQGQLFTVGWVADDPDEQTFLQLFYSKNAQRGGVNSANYSNPEFDKCFEQASVMQASPQRDMLYRRMQDIVNEDTAWIYEYYPVLFGLQYDWIKGYKDMDYGNGRAMNRMYITLDYAARQRWLKGER